jgi:uncharacterized protein YbgA (DUF1722 family)/uncharacterized protein YbbK (DUF523 family)
VDNKIEVGISQCLLGEKVRYDGGHKMSRYCVNHLNQFFDFKALCPEVGIGLPVPRKTIRLTGSSDQPRAVYSNGDDGDFTDALSQYADEHWPQINTISGYIFCKGSPSCGIERIKVFNDKGMPERNGIGIFAKRIMELDPLLPIEDDGRLNDIGLRDSFIKRVFLYKEWQQLTSSKLTPKALFDFHARHKLMLLAHCQKTYRNLGPMLAKTTKENVESTAESYISAVMSALKRISSRKNNTNVLMHIQGYFKKELNKDQRTELANIILDYKKGLQPLLAPMTLLNHYLKAHPNHYLANQSYFEPYPKEMGIRVQFQ